MAKEMDDQERGGKVAAAVYYRSPCSAGKGLVTTNDSFAAHPGRVDVIGTMYDKTTQHDSAKTTERQSMRVDVVDSIAHGGPSYPYMKPMNR